MEGFFCAILHVKIVGAGECIVSLSKEAQHCLMSTPHVCPVNCPVCHSFPSASFIDGG